MTREFITNVKVKKHVPGKHPFSKYISFIVETKKEKITITKSMINEFIERSKIEKKFPELIINFLGKKKKYKLICKIEEIKWAVS